MACLAHRWSASAAAVVLCVAGLGWAQQPQQPKRPQEPPAIRVEVNLVNIAASVLDAAGKPMAELPRGAFELLEEGRPQKIEIFEAETQQPIDLALMIDTSLSTLKELRFEQEAAAHFIRQVVRKDDRVAVFQFSDAVQQLSEYSSDVSRLQSAVRGMDSGAGTAMYDAIYLGAQSLETRPVGRRRVIILVTDAGETTSVTRYEEARRLALRSEAMLYTVLVRPVKSESGRNTGGEHALLTIADVSGGTLYTADTVADFEAIFDRIDRELRTQYRLGYYPDPRPPARSYRRVELRVKDCGEAVVTGAAQAGKTCLVRYRKGYFTGGDEPTRK